jgi:hypothetical protein
MTLGDLTSQTPELDRVDPSGAGILLRSRIILNWCNTRTLLPVLITWESTGKKKPPISRRSFYFIYFYLILMTSFLIVRYVGKGS